MIARDVEGNEFCLSGGTPPAPTMVDEVAVHIRRFEPQDRSRVLDLAKRLTSTTPAWRDRAAVEDALRTSISDILDTFAPNQAVLVAEVKDEAIGVLTVSERTHYTGALDASIDDLAVAEEWERRGVGRALLQGAENWALARGCERITVETGAGNERALRLYRTARFNDEDVRLTKVLEM